MYFKRVDTGCFSHICSLLIHRLYDIHVHFVLTWCSFRSFKSCIFPNI